MDILSTILKTTYTLRDVKHRIRILKSFIEQKLFGSAKNIETLASEDTSWLQTLGPDFMAQFNKNNVTAAFEEAEQAIEKSEAVILYLPFQTDQATVDQLGVWFRQNLAKGFIFDIKLDPTLIGGCALVKGGIYKDYSIKSRIHEQRDQILTEFRKYVR